MPQLQKTMKFEQAYELRITKPLLKLTDAFLTIKERHDDMVLAKKFNKRIQKMAKAWFKKHKQ